MSVFGILGEGLARGADAITPLFGTAATAAAIVLFTLAVRAALHPLARAAARGEKARAALAPQIAALQRKHKGSPERMQKATADLYAKAGASPLAGCLPSLLQLPVFFLMYHLFSTGGSALLDHTLLGAPLGGHWSEALADGGVLGPHGLVYLALFALIAAVATWNFRRARAAAAAAPKPVAGAGPAMPGLGGLAKVMPLLSFGMLITVAVVPLAAGLYTVTTTIWTACERALLHRDRKREGKRDRTREGKRDRTREGKRDRTRDGGTETEQAKGRKKGQETKPEPVAEAAPPKEEPAPRKRSGPKTRAARQRAARARAHAGRAVNGTSPGDTLPQQTVTTPQ
ncbi:membrane protein insertase YidC [Streptomyces sp. NPDC048483]|uniref:YidC/Oxa1 family membrane protein insertase n=1 Tax=Streptomyces sp. NPDC048483 TaxID=3154927 RepID=UPI003427A3FB